MDNIIWKTVTYRGEVFDKLEVSTDGRIRNAKTHKIYKTCVNHKGYVTFSTTLGRKNKYKTFRVHRIVAEVFIPNPDNKPEVNHKDGNKQNNCIDNLEWATSKENVKHAFEFELKKPLCGTNNPLAKLTPEDVKYIKDNYISRNKDYGARALGRKFNIDHGTILDIINGVSYVDV